MNKTCIHCQQPFLDLTKNLNRTHCGSVECKRIQGRIYRAQRDQDKYNVNQIRFKEANPNYLKEWRIENIDRDRKLNREWASIKYQNDLNYRLGQLLRSRLYKALKGIAKIGSHIDNLGCSIDQFKLHLEKQFEPWMNWVNYGVNGWEIDHIRPLSSADLSDIEQLREVCHYTNLRPLKISENRSKGDKYVHL